jgi:hypothetical protein
MIQRVHVYSTTPRAVKLEFWRLLRLSAWSIYECINLTPPVLVRDAVEVLPVEKARKCKGIRR